MRGAVRHASCNARSCTTHELQGKELYDTRVAMPEAVRRASCDASSTTRKLQCQELYDAGVAMQGGIRHARSVMILVRLHAACLIFVNIYELVPENA